jgi:hypothetical protein
MKKMASVLSTIARRAGGRVRRLRRGSILILVVVLLVLLALIGTAYVSTARTDRQSSQNYVVNSQVTQMADGIVNMVTSTLVSDLFDPTVSSPFAFHDAIGANFHPYTFAGNALYNPSASQPPVDIWLADRIPSVANSNPAWGAISGPLSSLMTFESPDGTAFPPANPNPRYNAAPTSVTLASGQVVPAMTFDGITKYVAADADGDGIADSMLFRIPGGYVNGLTYYAGVRIIDNNSAINLNTAMSRENDYVPNLLQPAVSITKFPDFGLFQSGVGLYELLSPLAQSSDFLGATGLNSYRFDDPAPNQPSNPNPWAYSAPWADFAQNYQYYGVPPQTTAPRTDSSYITLGESFYEGLIRRIGNPGINYILNPTSPTFTVARFQPLPRSEGARLAADFCIMNTIGGPSLVEAIMPHTFGLQATNPVIPTKAYLPGDTINWFHNFDYTGLLGAAGANLRALAVTRNPNSNFISPKYDSVNPGDPLVTGTKTGTVEPYVGAGMLPYGYNPSAGAWSATTLYAANDVVSYNGLNYLSVTNNGPSPTPPSSSPSWKRSAWRGMWASGATYQLNDIVQSTTGMTYLWCNSAQSNTLQDPGTYLPSAIAAGWKRQPWHPVPTKANVNTASFRELWRAFWCVMSGPALNNNLISPTPSVTPTANFTPFGNNGYQPLAVMAPGFNDPYGIAQTAIAPFPSVYDPYYVSPRNQPQLTVPGTQPPQRMFRSTLRDERYTIGSPPDQSVFRFDPMNMMLLRSALAAVNTLAMRSGTQDVISRTVTLLAGVDNGIFAPGSSTSGGLAPLNPVKVSVFSASPQLYITEVYANSDATPNDPYAMGHGMLTNPKGYVAVELYNPTGQAISVNNWQLGLLDRRNCNTLAIGYTAPTPASYNGSPYPNMQINQIGTLSGFAVPAYGYVVLENYPFNGMGTSATTDATFRPQTTGMPSVGMLTNATDEYIPNLYEVLNDPGGTATGGELVILKPRRFNGTLTASADPDNIYDEMANIYDLVPVDSFDFTGLGQQVTVGTASTYSYCHYVRCSDNPTLAGTHYGLWRCVYPGRYDGVQAGVGATGRQEGMDFSTSEVSAPAWQPPVPVQTPSFGNPAPASYVNWFCPIRIGDFNMPGPNPVSTSLPNKFPFGGFARNGDMLQIPYVGAYTVRVTGIGAAYTNAVLEMNSLPMDVSFADDGDTYTTGVNDDAAENIGRFCPISWATGQATALSSATTIVDGTYRNETALATPTSTFANWTLTIVGGSGSGESSVVTSYIPLTHTFNLATPLMPTSPDATSVYIVSPTAAQLDRSYRPWVGALFSYLTVHDPSDDYTPNTDPGPNVQTPTPNNDYAYVPANGPSPTAPLPAPVMNADFSASDQTNEHTVGVEGLININTASAKVLSTLPFVAFNYGDANANPVNAAIAQAIVAYRNSNGPFTSIMDLQNIPFFSVYRNGNLLQSNPPLIPYQSLPNPPTLADGNLTTGDPSFPGYNSNPLGYSPASGGAPLGDFQTQFLVLDRISNLVTVQSDSYTVYIVVEGWLNAGHPTGPSDPLVAQLVNTHRVAFQVDRNGVTPTNRLVRTTSVPEN